jgi:phosphonate transport system substrate-binding protein
MNRSIRVVTLMLLMVVVVVIGALPGTAAAEIRLGILPRLSATGMSAMFTPLADYLSQEIGEKVTIVIPKDFDAFKAEVKAGHVDLGFANPIVYVQLKQDAALDPLAVAAEQKGGTRFRGIIIARKDSGIEKVLDLKGKKLIFVEKDSAAGYVFQMLTLSKGGLDVQKDFTTLPFAKKHDNVAMAVFNKAADAGGIREDDLEKMKDKVDLAQIKVVAFTDYYPNWPLFATPKLDKGKAAKIRAALLKLKPNDPQSIKIVDAAKLVGFAAVSDKDYDEMRKAAKVAGAL